MAEFYQHEIGKWNVATDNLTLEQEAAYHRVVSMIRLYERPLRLNYRVLAGMWRSNETRAKRILKELIEAGKLTIEDGFIVDEKAVKDASTLRQRRMDKASAGRLGGIQSGKARAKSLKDNEQDEAPASTILENTMLYKEVEEAVAAPASEPIWNPDRLLQEILSIIGLKEGNRTSRYWMPPGASIHVWRWHTDHKLTCPEILEVIASSHEAHQRSPPQGPKAFDGAIALFASIKFAPPADIRDITTPASKGGSRNARVSEGAAFGRAINAVADGLSAGTIDLGAGKRDPFARRSG